MNSKLNLKNELQALGLAALFFAPALLEDHRTSCWITILLTLAGITAAYVIFSDFISGKLRDVPHSTVKTALTVSAFSVALTAALRAPNGGTDIVLLEATASVTMALILRMRRDR